MDLEKMAVSLRPRSLWEAVDLGVAILRRFWVPVYLAWGACVAPLFAMAFWLLEPWLACLLLWWVLPLLDRVPLQVISRALFGATPSLRQVLRALPSLWSRFLFASLVLGRPDPARSFHLPVQQLEGQSMGGYARRCSVLNHGNVGVAFLLTLSGWMLGAGVFLGLFVLMGVLLPEGWLGWPPEELFESPLWVGITASLLFLAVSIVEPMYVAAGFALYLNRRAELEGWDIELTFRRLRARLTSRSDRQRRPAGIVGLLLVACLLGVSLPAQRPQPSRPPREVIQEVLQHRDFGHEEEVTRWRRRSTTDEERETRPTTDSDPRTSVGVTLGEVLRVLMWVGVGGALLWLLYVVFKSRAPGSDAAAATGPPDTVRGLDVRPESLPENVADAAWQRFVAGDAAGCLSLLYRAGLAILIRDLDLAIVESSTEGDCLRLVRAVEAEAPAQARYFGDLTTAWTSCAYAHRVPEEAVARRLCEEWDQVFGGTS